LKKQRRCGNHDALPQDHPEELEKGAVVVKSYPRAEDFEALDKLAATIAEKHNTLIGFETSESQ